MIKGKKQKEKKGLQAIILAAGKSTRTIPLTASKPKALLKIAGQSILEHNLEALDGIVTDAVIVVGFEGHQIKQKIGFRKGGINITFVEQLEQLGTAHALKAAATRARDRFMVIMGDDLYSKEDLKKAANFELSILVKEVEDISNFGHVTRKGNLMEKIEEKSPARKVGLANTGCYVIGRDIFTAINKVKRSARNEFELTEALNLLAKIKKIVVVEASGWMPITYPWSLLSANEAKLAEMKKPEIKGQIEKGATIKGIIHLGKGSIIKAGAYIEGPVLIGEDSKIGPNCYIRASTSIGNNCYVGNGCEIKNSIIMDGSHAAHLSYVGDSILGENVNLGAGTVTANLRHDNNTIKSNIKEQLVDTGRKKLGAIIGDNVHTGIHTTIYPGRKIWPSRSTLPGEIVRKDVE